MTARDLCDLHDRVLEAGFGRELSWAAAIPVCADADAFCAEYAFVVVNSGMKAQVARPIYDRIMAALASGKPVRSTFGHPGKAKAIQEVHFHRRRRFQEYREQPGPDAQLVYLRALPWIGPITVWHLAKNLGVSCMKPDRHLVRIFGGAEAARTACEALARETGFALPLVDTIVWRAANLGMI